MDKLGEKIFEHKLMRNRLRPRSLRLDGSMEQEVPYARWVRSLYNSFGG